jgi:hypothetical protein
MKNKIREIAINDLNGLNIDELDHSLSKKFIRYIEAYSCELGKTKHELLFDDNNFEKVWSIYNNIEINTIS